MILLVGLAVDLGGSVTAQQHARSVAAQSARVGSERVLGGAAIEGEGAQIDAGAAATAARQYLAAAGVTGTVTARGNDTLLVSTSELYRTTFLSIIGIRSMRVTGRSTARLVRSQNGAQR